MAASSNTTWSKGFSGNPAGAAQGDLPLAELVRVVCGEWVVYPPGGEDALLMTRREALVRTLVTRGVMDGDMTAIKLLVELLEGKAAGDGAGIELTADQLAAAEAALVAWGADHAAQPAVAPVAEPAHVETAHAGPKQGDGSDER